MNKIASWEDNAGRKHRVILPASAPDSDAPLGIPDGPPDLAELGLPEETQTRLHNELFARGICNLAELRQNRQAAIAAVMAAFKVDVERLEVLYAGMEI